MTELREVSGPPALREVSGPPALREVSGPPALREVSGPSALGGGWRRSADLLYLMSTTNFKKSYFGTVLGYLWSLARPLMFFGVLVFSVVTAVIAVLADS